jgi:hypothetical protein
MTDENMARHRNSPHYKFWLTLKEGYDYFELTRKPPAVAVCERKYLVNVRWRGPVPANLDGESYCPAFERPAPDPFRPSGDQIAEERVTVPGPKMRALASNSAGNTVSGLTNANLGGAGSTNGAAGNGSTWGLISRAVGFSQ